MTDARAVTVVGAGTMGSGIAQAVAQAGMSVVLVDTGEGALERALATIRANLDGAVQRGKLSEEGRIEALKLLRAQSDLASAARESDVVIEAVPEQMPLKQTVLRLAEEVAPAHVLLASNTSSISITELQRPLRRPGRLVGMHFFNPVHAMKLVEVVRGQETEEEAVDGAVALARRLGKEPIVVRDSPGFASSRLGVALGLEAMRMLEEGVASAADIDKAMELGYRHPMGPLRLTDLVGLDVRLNIAEYLHATLEHLGGERFQPPAILRRLVAEGKLGRKTGQGFYQWDDA